MAYCDKCGAYIPDGHSVCLACGYDESAQEAAQTAAAAAAAASVSSAGAKAEKDTPDYEGSYYSFTNEELKERLEQQRRKQQEESRRWAEEEKARRERARQAAPSANSAGKKREGLSGSRSGDSKLLSAVSYLGVLFLLPMIFRRDDELAAFHAKQGLALFIYNIVAGILDFVPVVGPVMKLFGFYCIYKGMSAALKGKLEELPYIGRFFR